MGRTEAFDRRRRHPHRRLARPARRRRVQLRRDGGRRPRLDGEGAARAGRVHPGGLGARTTIRRHFADYLSDDLRAARWRSIPIYRERDGRRGRNSERIADVGGGLSRRRRDGSSAGGARRAPRPPRPWPPSSAEGGVVVAIAAAAQCAGRLARSIFTRRPDPRLRLAAGRGGGAELRPRPRPPAAQDAGGRRACGSASASRPARRC